LLLLLLLLLLLQSFIQRAGPQILRDDLPPKHELLLALARTPLQALLLQELLCVVAVKGHSLLRDMAVGPCFATYRIYCGV
jgi:hypothetical protein